MSVVKVTKEDRDAAWPWRNTEAYSEHDRAGWMAGIYDKCHTPIRAFARHRQSAIAELCEGLRRIEERVFPHPNSSHVYVDSIRAECRALLSKHSPDAPGDDINPKGDAGQA